MARRAAAKFLLEKLEIHDLKNWIHGAICSKKKILAWTLGGSNGGNGGSLDKEGTKGNVADDSKKEEVTLTAQKGKKLRSIKCWGKGRH